MMKVMQELLVCPMIALGPAKSPLPYAYYMLLRVGICGVFALILWGCSESESKKFSSGQCVLSNEFVWFVARAGSVDYKVRGYFPNRQDLPGGWGIAATIPKQTLEQYEAIPCPTTDY